MENLKRTALYEEHKSLKGKIVDFAGWELPVQYEGIIPEHEAVRNAAGIFDVSHMGEVEVKGKDAFDYIQKLITNDLGIIDDNGIIYTMLCYEHGGVVDDLLVYRYSKDHYLLVVNASNADKDYKWMVDNKGNFDVDIINNSDKISEIAIQGPKAESILQKICDKDLSKIKFFRFDAEVKVAGAKCLVSRTGYTGEDGFEVYTENENIVKIWRGLLEAGKEEGIKPVGLGARDTLRFEAGLPLYGNEISKDISPLEAGLGFAVKVDKEADFIGKSALKKQKEEGVKRKVVGFELLDKGIARHGYEVLKDGEVIGVVTTGYASPTLGKTIGFALIDVTHATLGTELQIKVRNRVLRAITIKKKFLKNK
ncbi:glycine cleavage system aminomethyltransferase GcvT [Hathewaya massiliensis]|uniref:glycine cleavage system aminomethyltransferase GcvT n=1 Tax=Hathewaya massiliensis TaxID=1964382 RepID=UPI0011576F6A|nr:glycine cleavage system aminomethyltransferase GcvT [Hathewaya massiliensis]